MAGTAIGTAYVELKKALRAVDADVWGERVPDITIGRRKDTGHEAVILGPVNGDGQSWSAIGARTRDEVFSIDIFILGTWPGLDPDEATVRAWALWAVVADVLAEAVTTSPIATDVGAWNAELKSPRGIPTEEDHGAGYVIESAVRFTARLKATP